MYLSVQSIFRPTSADILTRISTAADGIQAEGGSEAAHLSLDGRYVVFTSYASNLVAGDTNDSRDIFLKDLVTGAVTRVSASSNGSQANSGSNYDAHLSPDGRYVVFSSSASNLVTDDTNNSSDIFLKDLTTGAVTRLSTAANGTQANAGSNAAEFSPDGRYVAFSSSASNLVAGDTNTSTDIFLKDLTTGAVTRLSTAANGTQANAGSYNARFSPDGRYVVFDSNASDLVADDYNNARDIFLKDLTTGAVTRLSTAGDGTQADYGNSSYSAQFSRDGRYVFFESNATNLVAGDTNNSMDIFRFNLWYKANAAAMADNRLIETTLNVGNASSVRIDWGDGTSDVVTPTAGKVTLKHIFASNGSKNVTFSLVEGALTWDVGYTIDLAHGTMVRNAALADTMKGGTGSDTLTGDEFANVLLGSSGANRLDGRGGADTMDGGAGDDTYFTDGLDTIIEAAGGGIDTIIAGLSFSLAGLAHVENLTAADDTAGLVLTGNGLANILSGAAGTDRLDGAAGDDRLGGGLGRDSLAGGAGKDVFVFADRDTGATRSKADTILDFSGKAGDRIDLSAIDANTRKKGDQTFSFIGSKAFGKAGDRIDLSAIDANTRKKGDQTFSFIGSKAFGKAGEVRVEKTKKETFIYLNTDSDKAPEAVIKLKGAIDLSKGWFVL